MVLSIGSVLSSDYLLVRAKTRQARDVPGSIIISRAYSLPCKCTNSFLVFLFYLFFYLVVIRFLILFQGESGQHKFQKVNNLLDDIHDSLKTNFVPEG